jgi:hypothetical protein
MRAWVCGPQADVGRIEAFDGACRYDTSVALSQLNATAYFESDGGSDLVFVWVQKRCEGNRQ